ncbi:hypothetical protein REC12_02755 [Desulfosporosinus sp. PR]|uniref:hypothetical protein n=1 Tax=Candidatus Desulfosporosinus nitrosoreducens TaxID=3401928 RepID=UPI0027FC40D8|nr:hypothetical protein [Desulfosporosinus sp. PR]MDQ7092505.1 hypothetical protein [Desulfosporosinus sp. PR]
MKYFKRKSIMSVLFLFSGIMILLVALLQLMVKNSGAAFFLILVALMFVVDAYIYHKPYLGLDEERLVVNNSLAAKEIFLKDLTSVHEKNNRLTLAYTYSSAPLTLNILLSHLQQHDKEQFMKELRSKLGDKVYKS